tara:strand:+ start:24857 stop:27946 length:3090 start_codon:yes stop_codon:yes gene_type:complete
MNRGLAVLVVLSMLASYTPSSFASGLDGHPNSCEIIADWGQQWDWTEDGESEISLIHRYRVVFDPPFINGSSPAEVNATINHLREDLEIPVVNTSILVAGGEIDIILDEEPRFGDSISIQVNTAEASCNRVLNITNWNQPISDHEVTRETNWSLSGMESEGQGITFDGRGWQKRTGSILESNELGNGTLVLDMSNGSEGAAIDLVLEKIWLNESYEGTELISQDFEMMGSGGLLFNTDEGGDGTLISADVYDAYVLRSYQDGKITERMMFEGNGWISINGGDNESSGGVYGEVFLLYFETWDEDGFRRLQDIQVEANASARISALGGPFSFELDELIFREKWEEGVRTDQYSRIYGSGQFDFIASEESPYIEVNGTIPLIHFQSEGGETVSDTLIVDGTYDGDAEGSFGLVRQIVESGVYENATGTPFEADKIRNEFWFNVSATPFGPIDQELSAEHNLTYEYVVPQDDWNNRTIRYTFVDDNGSTEDEYPENSPIIQNPEAPEASPIFSTHISRETGVCPQILSIGDSFSLIGNAEMVLEVTVSGISTDSIDGHLVSIAEWEGFFGDMSSANGSIINEGPLSGLLNEVSRMVRIEIGEGSEVSLMENQRMDRILSPSIVTFDENTPPSISDDPGSSIGFRESTLSTEGGVAHLEVVVDDVDTDTRSVSVDLSSLGLGIVELSDSGMQGDQVIHDDVWTARIVHNGLQSGTIPIVVIMEDYWVTVQQNSSIQVANAPPRVIHVDFSPGSTFRGESIEVTIGAYDGHGIQSVAVNLQSIGGDLVQLSNTGKEDWDWQLSGESQTSIIDTWSGTFEVPASMSPGRQNIPILLEDNAGASISTTQIGSIYSSTNGKLAETVLIGNQPPSISNLTFLKDGNEVDQVTSLVSGGQQNFTMEVLIHDYDGVSSVQAKIGRLAPIGQSEEWLLLVDDGSGPDRFAKDGIFSLSFSARSSLSAGEMTLLIRATDVFLSTTPPSEQLHNVSIIKSDSGPSGESWMTEHSTEIVIASMLLLLTMGVVAFVQIIRNSELE